VERLVRLHESGAGRGDLARSGGGDADPGLAQLDRGAGTDLAPAPTLDLAVHADLAVLDQAPGLRAVIDDTGQLQELPEPDRLVADGYLDGVSPSVFSSGSGSPSHRGRYRRSRA